MNIPTIALSVRQPWAWAIIHGGKNIENRGKHALKKGCFDPRPIAIHASKGMTREEYEGARDLILEINGHCPHPAALDRGGIIGVVTVQKIVTQSESPWFFGPVGLVLANKVNVNPIPAKGALGYFKWERGGKLDEAKPWMRKWEEK